jgi:LPS sulfotransferase NodH
MWMHLPDLAAFAGTSDTHVLEHLFPEAKYVWVRRDDRVRQAISLWKAMQTQTWRAQAAASDEPPRYDREAIDHLVGLLTRDDEAWARHFADRGIEPLTLTYEEHIAPDPTAAAQRVLDVLGIEGSVPEGVVPIERQADDTSEWWIAQHTRGAA